MAKFSWARFSFGIGFVALAVADALPADVLKLSAWVLAIAAFMGAGAAEW